MDYATGEQRFVLQRRWRRQSHGILGIRGFAAQRPDLYPIADLPRAYGFLLERNQTPFRNIRGIAYYDGRVEAVQVGFSRENDYPDHLSENGHIEHIGEGFGPSQPDTGGNHGMLEAHRNAAEIPVFQAVGRKGGRSYVPLGKYRVADWGRSRPRLKDNDFETDAYYFVLQPTLIASGPSFISDAEANALAEDAVDVGPAFTEEGRKTLRTHLMAERNPGFREAVLQMKGYRCEACNVDFGERYGPELAGFIEVHHLRPISLGPHTPSLSDFAVLCPNCHRAAHKGRVLNPRSVEELRSLIARSG